MESAKFKYVTTNFNYEIVELSDGTSYLVDMGTPVIAWLTLVAGCFIPRRCYAISNEDKANILRWERKRSKSSYTGFATGIAVLISNFSEDYEDMLSFHVTLLPKVFLILAALIVPFGVRSIFVHRAQQMIVSRGVDLTKREQFKIRFSAGQAKPLLKQILLAVIVWGMLSALFAFLLQSSMNIVEFLMFGVLFFALLGITSTCFREDSTYFVRKIEPLR